MTRYIITWLTDGKYSTGITLGVKQAQTPGHALLKVAEDVLDDSLVEEEMSPISMVNLALFILGEVENKESDHEIVIHKATTETSLEEAKGELELDRWQ